MTDRSALALQLTDAIALARAAVEHAGDRAFRAYGLSHRAHAVLLAVDLGGPDGARPKDVAAQLDVSRAAASTVAASVFDMSGWQARAPSCMNILTVVSPAASVPRRSASPPAAV